MPLLLLLAGLILVVTGVKGTVEHLGGLLKKDFTGQGNFAGWIFAIAIAGGFGYVPQLRAVSTAFLVMIIVAILVKKQPDGSSTGKKFFDGITGALNEINSGSDNANPSSLNDVLGGIGNLFGTASDTGSSVADFASLFG